MIQKILSNIFNTDSLPIVGGAGGAITQAGIILPTQDLVINTIILAGIGAMVGYMVKLFLDCIVDYYKKFYKK